MFTKTQNGWVLSNPNKEGYTVNQELLDWMSKVFNEDLVDVTPMSLFRFKRFIDGFDRISGKIYFIGDYGYPISDQEMKRQLFISIKEVENVLRASS